MRVAVVYPEVLDMARYRELRREFPPFGALYIAAALEGAGHQVQVYKLQPDDLIKDFRSFDVVAFSISASATFNMFLECRFKSSFKENALILAGGVHANLLPEQTLRDLKPDVVGVGEGEQTILDILDERDTRRWDRVQGVCYLDGRVPRRTEPRRVSRYIDSFPFPARHLIPVEDFVMDDRMSNTRLRMTHIMPGRGCPFPCRYCASAQTTVQYRSGANIAAELAHLVDAYGIQGFAVVGNDFILSKRNVVDICQSIAPLGLRWATLSRVDRVDPDLLGVMRDGGCYELEYGVESGSQRILDAMDKRIKVEQIRKALSDTASASIKNKVFLVHGFPGEDLQSTLETIALLEEVGQWIERVSLFRFVPLPGTFVYNNPAHFGLRNVDSAPNWDGDWGKYHIHHNHHHWWGTEDDFARLSEAYSVLQAYVERRWPSRFGISELPEDKWQRQSKDYALSGPNLHGDDIRDKMQRRKALNPIRVL